MNTNLFWSANCTLKKKVKECERVLKLINKKNCILILCVIVHKCLLFLFLYALHNILIIYSTFLLLTTTSKTLLIKKLY